MLKIICDRCGADGEIHQIADREIYKSKYQIQFYIFDDDGDEMNLQGGDVCLSCYKEMQKAFNTKDFPKPIPK